MKLYAYMAGIVKTFEFLGAWQQIGLTLWCCGVALAQRCEISAVADALVGPGLPSVTALEKRLSRWLNNPRISDEMLSQEWVRLVHRQLGQERWVVLVDETKLGGHLSVMMVGVAWRYRVIPLLWRCYHPKAYPAEGQVKLIAELIERLRLLVPAAVEMVVQADRGIGTSPDLIREFNRIGVRYLLRVQGQVRLRLKNGKEHALTHLVQPGTHWCGYAEVFKKQGWMRLFVRLDWRLGEKSPWCLVTNDFWQQARDYRQRGWHEQSFRDLKSFGLNWQMSQTYHPAHAHRLVFVLAIVYAWIVSQALLFTPDERLSPSRSHPRQSIFRRGLRWLRQQMNFSASTLSAGLNFTPPLTLIC